MNEYIEDVCRKLRLTVSEYGQKTIDGAVIVDSIKLDGDMKDWQIGGHKYLFCPTMAGPFLGNVPYNVARFFEDV